MLKYVCLSLFVLIFLLLVAINLPISTQTHYISKANSIFVDKGWPVHIGGFSLLLNGEIGPKQVEIIPSLAIPSCMRVAFTFRLGPRCIAAQAVDCKKYWPSTHCAKPACRFSYRRSWNHQVVLALHLPKLKMAQSHRLWISASSRYHSAISGSGFIDPRHGIGLQEVLYKAEIVTTTAQGIKLTGKPNGKGRFQTTWGCWRHHGWNSTVSFFEMACP